MSTPTPAPATNATAPPPPTLSLPPLATPSPPPPSASVPPPDASSPPPPPPASALPPETPSPPPPTAPSPTPPTPAPPPPSTSSSSSSPPPPSTSSPLPDSPPPPVASSPPPTTASPPPPSDSSPPSSSASPPPPSRSSPPAVSSSPPPPSTPSPPTSSTSPPPPRSSSPPTSSSPPPPPPSTNSTTPSLLSPPPPLTSGSNPARSPPPPPPTSTSSSSGISAGVVVGIAIGGIAILLVLIIFFVCFRKKRRHRDDEAFHAQPPLAGYKDDPYGAPPSHWRQNPPQPPGPIVGLMGKPSPPPAVNAYTPPFLQPYISSSGGSGSNYSGSESQLPPPPPGSVLGFSKSTFTYEELALATDGFSEANLLGQGGFGYVHRGVLPNGKEVAVKQLKAGSGQGEREFQAEVEIISRVHHRHLVSLVGYCITGSQRLLVYDYIPNNTLEFHLHGKGRPTMDWPSRMRIALGSAKGLAYLHEDCNPKIIHRDIKAANILLDFKFEAKVADFGLAKFTSDINTHVSTRVMGTFGYLAPEYASSGKLSEKSDVFSFGVMLLELITGHRPVDTTQTFMEDSLVDWARPLLIRAVEEENFDGLIDPKLQGNFSPTEMARMVACAAACVRHSAKRRPRMSQVVRALEGDATIADLNEGVRPGHSTVYGESSDYDSSQYREDMKKFRKMALGSKEYGASGEYSGGTSDYGLYPSESSSEGQTTREMELRRLRNGSQGFS